MDDRVYCGESDSWRQLKITDYELRLIRFVTRIVSTQRRKGAKGKITEDKTFKQLNAQAPSLSDWSGGLRRPARMTGRTGGWGGSC